jgi:hypothetical protein
MVHGATMLDHHPVVDVLARDGRLAELLRHHRPRLSRGARRHAGVICSEDGRACDVDAAEGPIGRLGLATSEHAARLPTP